MSYNRYDALRLVPRDRYRFRDVQEEVALFIREQSNIFRSERTDAWHNK